MAAVGKFVLWGKENLCLIRPLGDSLALETLYYAEDVRAREEIDASVGEIDVRAQSSTWRRQLVESLVGDFDPEEYENEYRNDLRAMLEAKLEGKEIVAPEPAEGSARRRPHGGAQAERRPGAEGQADGGEAEGQEVRQAPAKKRAAAR